MNAAEVVLDALRRRSEDRAFVELEESVAITTTSQLQSEIREIAALFRGFGIHEGHRVLMLMESSADFARVFLALLLLRAVPILGRIEFRKMELDEVFANSDPHAVIAERYHLPVVSGYLPGRVVMDRAGGRLSLVQAGAQRVGEPDIPDYVASINYTYRGYGYPLGALVTHAQYLRGAELLQEALCGRSGERVMALLPMTHIFGMAGIVFLPLLYDMTCVVPRTLHPRRLFAAIEELEVNHLFSVPEVYELLRTYRDRGPALASLDVFACGGSRLDADQYRAITRAFGVVILHGYGLTEFAPAARPLRGNTRAGTIGPPCAGVEARIADPDAAGNGEIRLRVPEAARAYYRRPKETAEAFSGGWLRTGDLGRWDGDHLVFVKELKRTHKVNGDMVDLAEVEGAICRVEGVERCVVSQVEGRLHADVVHRGNEDTAEAGRSIKRHLSGWLSAFKVPKTIRVSRV
jgi:long-subunit acyl-CoA synthetase (AMP-forming)